MLTIGQLASYAGVTVRAIRHYHAKGLLPEPARDHSGYRRYDAASVVQLVKIRTLADAGVPLARVGDLLAAGQEEFTAAVTDIDGRLLAEIRERQRHRERIAQLAAGDSLALPTEAVAYLDRLRALGFADVFVNGERDAWILVAAQLPDQMPLYMSMKQQQLDDPASLDFYHDIAAAIDWEPDDPRLAEVSDKLAALLDTAYADDPTGGGVDQEWPPELIDLLDSVFLDQFPYAARLMKLLEARGWRGWTHFERIPST